MNFSDILDEIAKPTPSELGMEYGRSGASSSFWSVLERIEAASPMPNAAVRQAYFPDIPTRGSAPTDGGMIASDLSLDPDDILDELDLDDATTLDGLSAVRRRFARINHPDLVPAALRDRANVRMTIANTLIDSAAERLAR